MDGKFKLISPTSLL